MALGMCLPSMAGMKVLDKSKFEIRIRVPAFRINQDVIDQALKGELRNAILNLPRIPRVVADTSSQPSDKSIENKASVKLILLDPEKILGTDPENWPEYAVEFFRRHSTGLVDHEIILDYDYWSIEDIYDSVLPPHLPRHYSYETIGHIAHLNLREELEEYKRLIGEIILSKNSAIKTVVNKLDTVNNVFRTFQMEVIAGEYNFVTLVREGNCIFELDFSKVYWNSKLQTEHQRIVDKYFSKGDFICDPFTGIGPFALNAAKNKQTVVFASDINPDCYKCLLKNIRINKLKDFVYPFCMDAREFITKSMHILNSEEGRNFVYTALSTTLNAKPPKVKEKSISGAAHFPTSSTPLIFNHYVLNLPETSFNFLPHLLDIFRGFSGLSDTPTIHVYCFSRIDSKDRHVLLDTFVPNLNSRLGTQLSESDIIEIHNVRKVAPSKSMYCISLKLPRNMINA